MSTKSYVGRVSWINSNSGKSWFSNGVFAGSTSSSSLVTVPTGGTRTGVSNPHFREQIARGENATTTFSASKATAGMKPGSYHYRTVSLTAGDKSSEESSGVFCPGWYDPAGFTLIAQTKADNRARMDFYKKARKAQRNIQSGVLIGELMETIRMIRDPAIAMRSLVDVFVTSAHSRARGALRSTSRRGINARRDVVTSKAIGDSWLEFAFGWAPLASDLKGGAEALARIQVQMEHELKPVTGIGNEEIVTPVNLDQFNQIPGQRVWYREEIRDLKQATVKYYGRVRVGLPGSPDCQAMAALGLTLGDIVPTVWELVPWSFLIDYFSNIGNVIDACCFPQADIAWSSVTKRSKTRRTTTWTYRQDKTYLQASAGNLGFRFITADNLSSFSEKTTVSRFVSPVFIPSIEFELPLKLGKLLNIAGLVIAGQRPPGLR